jgi:hypothetical protein
MDRGKGCPKPKGTTMNLTRESITDLLARNDNAVARALVLLNARQNVDEQIAKDSKYRNGRGFKPCHAARGTGCAEFFQRAGFLTPKQIAYWRVRDKNGTMRIAIYWRQLIEEAEAKAARKAG